MESSPTSNEKKDSEKFLAEDLCVLFSNFQIFPTTKQTKDEKLNSLTRLALIITIGLYFYDSEPIILWSGAPWFSFLIISLLIILLLKYAGKSPNKEILKEDFTIVPTYTGLNLQETTVAPLFAEEWQIYPPAYDLYVNTPPPSTFNEPLKPQSYPYGQYLTRTNLLPSDEEHIRMLSGGPRNAREFANNAFLRNDLAFRENMTRLYKKSLSRRYRSSCNDTFSPYSSY